MRMVCHHVVSRLQTKTESDGLDNIKQKQTKRRKWKVMHFIEERTTSQAECSDTDQAHILDKKLPSQCNRPKFSQHN